MSRLNNRESEDPETDPFGCCKFNKQTTMSIFSWKNEKWFPGLTKLALTGQIQISYSGVHIWRWGVKQVTRSSRSGFSESMRVSTTGVRIHVGRRHKPQLDMEIKFEDILSILSINSSMPYGCFTGRRLVLTLHHRSRTRWRAQKPCIHMVFRLLKITRPLPLSTQNRISAYDQSSWGLRLWRVQRLQKLFYREWVACFLIQLTMNLTMTSMNFQKDE